MATTPYIAADKILPEITFKAVILAIIITTILCAADAYLALKLGQTIAASIPAAVISMGVLRLFRKHNILENNIVQTAASAGEGVAAAVSFVLPSLLMIGYWKYFHYWETALITAVGGTLGVLFSIPLRRVMLNYPTLRFPEGTAIGNVLKASASGTSKMKHLLEGGIVGSVIGLLQTGFKILSDSMQYWTVNGKLLMGMTIGFSPALLGAGFIVGMQACAAMLVGLVLVWIIGMPILTHFYGLPAADSYFDMAMVMRADHIRFIGVGTMLLGGTWTMATLIKPIVLGVTASVRAFKESQGSKLSSSNILRTERDIPINYVIIGTIALSIATFFLLLHLFNFDVSIISNSMRYGLSAFALLFILIAGFFIASVCAYLSGLVGITNNPLSGLLIICVLISSLALLPILSQVAHNPEVLKVGMAITLITTAVVAAVVIISGENIQDLKAGQMVGATPWKQQVMLLIGMLVAACVIGPVLELLFQAYGIGGVFPRAGMDPTAMLAAPQAGLMTAIAQGAFGHSLPMIDLTIGIGIALVAIFVDEYLKRRGKRLPILAIGIGIYLPPDITSAVIIGGILNFICKKVITRRQTTKENPEVLEKAFEGSTLIACGLVAGAALMGVILAIPFVIKGSADALSLVSAGFMPVATVLSLITTIGLCIWLYRITCNKQNLQQP